MVGAAHRQWLWRALAWHELRRRYARTAVGPLWNALSLALAAVALTFVFGRTLGAALPSYPVFIVSGLAIWQFVLGTIGEAPLAFAAAAETIRTAPLPISVFVLRLVWRNLIVLATQAPVIAAALVLYGVRPAPGILLLPAALLLTTIAALGASLLLATMGARFRDVQPIVGNLLQLLFFLTPIFWVPASLPPGRAWLVHLNPLSAFVDILRAPLIGAAIQPISWAIASTFALFLIAAGILVFGWCRPRIPYWA